MGLFQDPRRKPDDTRSSYARRRAPWLVIAALGCTYYVSTQPVSNAMSWVGVGLVWVAAIVAGYTADWSDLRK